MGWIVDGAYDHEGWVANVLADGRVASSSTGGGVIVHELTGDDVVAGRQVRRYEGSAHLEVTVPWDQVVTWRLTCECGWTGEERLAVGEAGGSRDCPEELQERIFYPAWAAHVAPYTALHNLEQLTEQARDLERRIAETVHLARTGGASWAQIGRADGLSKQGAQQRWSHLTTAGTGGSARGDNNRLREEALGELAAATATMQSLTSDLSTRTGDWDGLSDPVEGLTRELTTRRQHRPGRPSWIGP